ncbi:hypothetical protein K788_0000074 [Paraburkholderia caribensis MBA4]|uniref:Uncharacterized protein n=1 Tax=Paraburkholderia caribensis MBA4 TaxID=1323664 RepID=A0A0P0RJI8_9BURK|nr:hypothetical protein K788_0000074 [Paraburkholderia caribensis MBA4]
MPFIKKPMGPIAVIFPHAYVGIEARSIAASRDASGANRTA